MSLDENARRGARGIGVGRIAVDQDERMTAFEQQHDLARERARFAAWSELIGEPLFDLRLVSSSRDAGRMSGKVRELHRSTGEA